MIAVEELLNPISGDNACGKYLQYDIVYDEIKEAKREDDPRLPQGVWQIEIKKADWKEVERLCLDVLQNKSKDLQVALWLAEAYTALFNWEGFSRGLEIVYALCDKFWPKLYPEITEDNDCEFRISALASFISKIRDKILLLPITRPVDEMSPGKSISDWIMARYRMQLSEGKQYEFDALRESQSITNDIFFIQTEHFVSKIVDQISHLDKLLSDNTSNASPSFGGILSVLKDVLSVLDAVIVERGLQKWEINEKEYIAPKKENKSEKVIEEIEEEISDSFSAEEEGKSIDGDPLESATVEQAYAALDQISKFLEKKQPQNPVSALVNVALALSNKTFAELMNIKTSENEPIISSVAKLCSVLSSKNEQSANFDKSMFDGEGA